MKCTLSAEEACEIIYYHYKSLGILSDDHEEGGPLPVFTHESNDGEILFSFFCHRLALT